MDHYLESSGTIPGSVPKQGAICGARYTIKVNHMEGKYLNTFNIFHILNWHLKITQMVNFIMYILLLTQK